MAIGLLLLAIFVVAAALMFTRTLPALIVLPLMGIAIAGGAALITGEISAHDLLDGVIAQGAMRLHPAMVVAFFGGALSFLMQKSGVAENAVKQGAELVGANPLAVGVFSLLLVAVLFTSLGGLGAVIMVSMIVLPMLATVGLSPVAGAAIVLFGMSLGGVLNPSNWVLYVEVMQVPVDDIKSYALVLFGIVMLAGCGLVLAELIQGRLVRLERRFLMTAGAFLAIAGVLVWLLVRSAGAPSGVDEGPAVWLVWTRRVVLVLFGLVLIGILRDLLRRAKRWRQQEVNIRGWAYLIPVVPLIAILLFDVPILAAFVIGFVYAVLATLRPGSLPMAVQSLIEGGASVMPAVVLMFGIGILVSAMMGPSGWSEANGGATWPVLSSVEPVLERLVPKSQIGYVLGFGLAAPLALYRGPLNVWGLGFGVATILLSSGALPGTAIMAMLLAVGQVQGICDPTNTANVWIANQQGVDVQAIMWRTLPFVWIAVFVALTVAGVWFL